MNLDEFENRLRRQPLLKAPAEWREEILANANPQQHSRAAEQSVPLWRLIFGQYPVASGAFAGFWIVVIGINLLLFSGTDRSLATQSTAAGDDPSSIWRLQSPELQQLAGGDQLIIEPPAPVPPKAPVTPRSDLRREDEGVGETSLDGSFNFIA